MSSERSPLPADTIEGAQARLGQVIGTELLLLVNYLTDRRQPASTRQTHVSAQLRPLMEALKKNSEEAIQSSVETIITGLKTVADGAGDAAEAARVQLQARTLRALATRRQVLHELIETSRRRLEAPAEIPDVVIAYTGACRLFGDALLVVARDESIPEEVVNVLNVLDANAALLVIPGLDAAQQALRLLNEHLYDFERLMCSASVSALEAAAAESRDSASTMLARGLRKARHQHYKNAFVALVGNHGDQVASVERMQLHFDPSMMHNRDVRINAMRTAVELVTVAVDVATDRILDKERAKDVTISFSIYIDAAIIIAQQVDVPYWMKSSFKKMANSRGTMRLAELRRLLDETKAAPPPAMTIAFIREEIHPSAAGYIKSILELVEASPNDVHLHAEAWKALNEARDKHRHFPNFLPHVGRLVYTYPNIESIQRVCLTALSLTDSRRQYTLRGDFGTRRNMAGLEMDQIPAVTSYLVFGLFEHMFDMQVTTNPALLQPLLLVWGQWIRHDTAVSAHTEAALARVRSIVDNTAKYNEDFVGLRTQACSMLQDLAAWHAYVTEPEENGRLPLQIPQYDSDRAIVAPVVASPPRVIPGLSVYAAREATKWIEALFEPGYEEFLPLAVMPAIDCIPVILKDLDEETLDAWCNIIATFLEAHSTFIEVEQLGELLTMFDDLCIAPSHAHQNHPPGLKLLTQAQLSAGEAVRRAAPGFGFQHYQRERTMCLDDRAALHKRYTRYTIRRATPAPCPGLAMRLGLAGRLGMCLWREIEHGEPRREVLQSIMERLNRFVILVDGFAADCITSKIVATVAEQVGWTNVSPSVSKHEVEYSFFVHLITEVPAAKAEILASSLVPSLFTYCFEEDNEEDASQTRTWAPLLQALFDDCAILPPYVDTYRSLDMEYELRARRYS